MEPKKQRVVVTGLGAVVPHGPSMDTLWAGVRAGQSAIDTISRYDPRGHKTEIAAEVRECPPCPDTLGPFALDYDALRFAWASAAEALKHAGLEAHAPPNERRAVVYTTGVGPATLAILGGQMARSNAADIEAPWKANLTQFFGKLASAPEAVDMRGFLVDDCAPLAAWMLGGTATYNVASACASGSQAIADACLLIEQGEADLVLTGGSCTGVNSILVNGFAILGALSNRNDEPTRASRPFDIDRDGFVLGEGSVTLILENEAHALARGATVLATLPGWGLSGDAYRLTDPEPGGAGMSLAMRRALDRAGLPPSAVDYINAHGTSTPYNDPAECLAIRNTFGDHADTLAVSSSKSMFGHLIQVAGLIEAAVCIRALQDGWVPPTINVDNQDPDCNLDVVPNEGRATELGVVLSNSFGFGGQNASILFAHPERT